jgi:hypothetical protein
MKNMNGHKQEIAVRPSGSQNKTGKEDTKQQHVTQQGKLKNMGGYGSKVSIEDTIFEEILPVNTIPVIHRLEEILREHQTNSLIGIHGLDDRVEKLLMLLIMQYYGDLQIDLYGRWQRYQVNCTYSYQSMEK